MRKSYRDDNGEKIYRYSIRKYHFGAASVAVAALMFFANGVQAQAPAVSPVTASDVVAGPSGNSDGDSQDSDEESPEKKAVVEQPVELKSAGESSAPEAKAEEGSQEESEAEVKSPQPETKIDENAEVPQVAKEKDQEVSAPVADTSAAKSTQSTLEALLANLTLDSMKALRAEVEEGLAKAKAVLENPKATQAQVDEQVKLMEDLTRRVKEALSPQVSTPPVLEKAGLTNTTLAAPEGTVLTPKEAVTKVLEKNPVASTNGEVRIPSTKLSKSEVSDNQNKEKLKTISKDLSAYLTQANEITRPETKKLLEGVEEIVKSIEASVSQPQLTPAEIEELLKKGKQAEKKLALALTREKSGKRDLLNGHIMNKDAYFRAYDDREARRRVYDAQGNSGQENALVGYFTKEEDRKYGYEPGTFLYISHNDDRTGAFSSPDLGRQPVNRLKGKVFAEVTKAADGSGYHWKIIFNEGKEPRQNPIYYFTIPAGQAITNMTLKENENVVKSGGVAQVFNGANDKYQTAVGSPESGVNGTPYYENIANVTHSIIGNRDSIRTLDDFVKNDTGRYFNRNGIPQKDIDVSDKLYEKIKGSTQNIFSLKPKEYNAGSTYTVEFDTKGNTTTPLYYIAGMKSYEAGGGTFQHKSYQQWNRVQERYNIKVDDSKAKTTFLKGTGVGLFDDERGLKSGAITLEDTYNNNKKLNPEKAHIVDYKTYKPTGNFYNDYYANIHNRYSHKNASAPDDVTADSTKGYHLLHIEASIDDQKIEFNLPYRVVTQADVYQPIVSDVLDTKNYSEKLKDASTYIKSYADVSSTIPKFKRPDYRDMTAPNPGRAFYKDLIESFPTTSDQIKDQSVRSTEWVGGSSLSTGSKVIELTLENNKKTLFTVPSDIDVFPGGKISAENVKKT